MKTLEETLDDAWALLVDGAGDRRAAFHVAQVATVALDGRPSMRTVVLRDADPAARRLRFHTDTRSDKIAEMRANPAVGLLFYDADRKIQLRIDGCAKVHRGDAMAETAWAASRTFSRACYLASVAPGTCVARPPDAAHYDENEDDAAFENFCAVTIDVKRFEWLHLAANGHQRARFSWNPDGSVSMSWIAP